MATSPSREIGKDDGGSGEGAMGQQFDGCCRGMHYYYILVIDAHVLFQLCDDSFEEHVLPYSAELTGLHLHGLNESTRAFKTRPSDEVATFARDWGFLVTAFHTVKTVAEVKAFSEEVAKAGGWNGQALEGFVVRCHVGEELGKDKRSAPPYPPNSSFFFKVKYDEPYMMYRDWREVTKMLLSTKGRLEDVKIPKSKLRRPETKTYIEWVKKEIKRDREPFKNYTKGKGIIATREKFLTWLKDSGEDVDQLATQVQELSLEAGKKQQFGKTIIVTVAIPGCGKCCTNIVVSSKHSGLRIQARQPLLSLLHICSALGTCKVTMSLRRDLRRFLSRML